MTAWVVAKGILIAAGILTLISVSLTLVWNWLIEWDSKKDKTIYYKDE